MAEEKTKSLKIRFLVLTTLIFCATAGMSLIFINQINKSVIHALGSRFAENQLLYDKARVLLPLSREVALARKLADSSLIKAWAQNEDDPHLKERGLRELEEYRRFFKDGSYFFVIDKSLNYYFNDSHNSYFGNQLRYTIKRGDPESEWYFSVLQNRAHQLNVDFDKKLGVTKVWINIPIYNGKTPLGVIGTGIDLTLFIQTILSGRYEGITNIFLGKGGAIQAHQDISAIDFKTLTKDPSKRKTIFQFIDRERDRNRLSQAMERVQSGERETETFFMKAFEKEYLAGVTYLPNIRWFNLTLMDVDRLLPKRYFTVVVILLGISLLIASSAIAYLLNKLVLTRIGALNQTVETIMNGNLDADLEIGENDEIGSLTRNFSTMTSIIRTNTETLEQQINERTEELKRLSERDSMTMLLNRRGLLERWDIEMNRVSRSGHAMGVLIIDIDLFKSINDTYGHKAGDYVITSIAKAINTSIRSYDHCSRWGGEEFLILLPDCTEEGLQATAQKVRRAIKELGIEFDDKPLAITASLGGYLMTFDENVDSVIGKADIALYEAKRQGRDCYIRYSDELAKQTPPI